MSSFFSLGRHKNTTSPTAQSLQFQTHPQQQQHSHPQPPPQPLQPANNLIGQKRSGSARRRLSKRERVSRNNPERQGPITRNRDVNKTIGLGAISTSPFNMTFGSDAPAPAGSGLKAAATTAAAPLATPASPPPAAAVKHTNNIQHTPEILQLREAYNVQRHRVADDEAAYAFDHVCRVNATQAECLANDVLLRLKQEDQELVFNGAGLQTGYGSQEHARFAGDHYLTNVSLIQKTKVLQAARKMPKGAHLHIHYNACLAPTVLLNLAAKMDRMFIMSSKKLLFGKEDPETGKMDGSMDDSNFFLSAISFSILAPEKERPGNLFSEEYKENQTMPFRQFLAEFPADKIGKSAMDWLAHKLVFSAEETYDIPQTAAGAWQRFNDRTKMMKGLFNYETAYREYTKLFLQDLLDDNIQYAEIRPNFMTNNQLWNDEGTKQVDNAGIVTIITDACDEFVARNAANFKAGVAGAKKNFDGIKIIYCTPRSFQRTQVRAALAECIEFKKRWPQYIAGFDLVGEEGQGKSLNFFVSEFLEFKENCKAEGLDIPFLFHCGETLSIGTSVDGNVVDALLLGAKRIGHGFALPRHPVVLERMKQRNVCVEVCPISNEVLGLTPRISGHAVYDLLARNFPCTVNSDNGTLFQSSLSHDFYQVLVGKADMGLYGWRQLAEWSLTHACFTTPDDLARARAHWLDEWQDFVLWLLREFDSANPETQAVLRELALAGDKTGVAKPAPVEADRSRL